jgi:hypothetical protein
MSAVSKSEAVELPLRHFGRGEVGWEAVGSGGCETLRKTSNHAASLPRSTAAVEPLRNRRTRHADTAVP